MNENKTPDEETGSEETGKSKGKKGKGETGALGRGEVSVQPAFYEYMAKIGASVSQISQVLGQWRHLRGGGLARALMDFARSMTRASAHAEVEIAQGKDYGLLHHVLKHMKSLVQTTPAHKNAPHQHNKPEL